MKRCPQCSEVYSDQLQFCLKDGRPLTPIPADDDDYDTVVRPEPIVIDITDPPPLPEPVYPDDLPPQPIEGRGKVNIIAVLIAGTIIGGLLVLVAILAFALVFRDRPTVNQSPNVVKNSNIVKASPTERPTATTPASSPKGNSNSTPDDNNNSDEARREMLAKEGFNGRVIKINAVVRSLPSIDSDEVAVLPYDEPVKIGKPAAEHNPWYRVTTTDGTTGWMHGNTIEFTR